MTVHSNTPILDLSRDRCLHDKAVRYAKKSLAIGGAFVVVAAVLGWFTGGSKRIDLHYEQATAPVALTGVVELLAEREGRSIETYEDEPIAALAGRAEALFGDELPNHWNGFLQEQISSGWQRFQASYVVAFTYVVSLSLGCLFFVLIQHLTRAGWSVVVRRVAEVLAACIAPLSLLSLPIIVPLLFGSYALFEWNDPQLVASDELIQHKRPYLNPGFFTLRCLIYFATWSCLGHFFLSRSRAQDKSSDLALTHRMQGIAPIGMLLFALTVNFFAFDFLMSLAPHWFSTIYGVYYFSGSVIAGLSVMIIACAWLQRAGVIHTEVTTEHYHDLGKLLFGFIFFWGYIAFSQYLLIWYANIPEETGWFLARQENGWQYVSLVLLFGHLFIPFCGLLSRKVRRNKQLLVGWAGWMLVMHFVDLYWNVMPQFSRTPSLHLTDLFLIVGLTAFFFAAVVRTAAQRSWVPLRDPRLQESLVFHNS